MSKAQQRKGADGERELMSILRGHGYDVRRGGSLSFGEVPDLYGLPGIHIEVKRRENVNLTAALEQARRDADRFGGLPAVFHRRNREGWRVTMTLPDWMQIFRSYQPPIDSNHGG